MVKNRGKRIKTNQQTLDISRLFRFVFIIVYGHTFVCHRLNKWAAEGTDLTVVLPVLSKYLGHTSVQATAWYLRLTAEVYPEVIHIMDHYTIGVFPTSGEVDSIE